LSFRQGGFFILEKGGDGLQTGAPPKQGRFTDPRQNFMILSVCAKLNEIYEQGCKFNWTKPDRCPRCNSVRLWGHGYVRAYFDGFSQGLLLRRFRCPDCGCIIRMKPKGYFRRFQAPIHTIRSCLIRHISGKKWHDALSKSRQRHWLSALKRKASAYFSLNVELCAAFDRLIKIGLIPVSRGI
jgi:hypothetical protein